MRDIIYSNNDPCLDCYFSTHYSELLIGSRRMSSAGSLVMDCMTCRAELWPNDLELGEFLLAELERIDQRVAAAEVVAGAEIRERLVAMSSAVDAKDFEASFWYSTLWTKRLSTTPYIVGAPINSYYSDSFNRRPIEKSVSASELGASVKAFLRELATALGQAGLERWSEKE